MLPFRAISRHLLGLAFVVALTAGTAYVAIDIERGVKDDSSDLKGQVFDYVVGLSGVKVVVSKKYKDPPNWVKFASI